MSRYDSSTTPRRGGIHFGLRHHNVIVPASRAGATVFPTNKTTGRIDFSMYHPPLTQSLISDEEVASFLQGVDAFVQPVFKSDFIDRMKIIPWIFLGLLILLAIIIMGIIMEFIKTSIPIYISPLIFFGGIVILGTFFQIAHYFMVVHVKRKIKEAKEKIQAYLLQYNGAFQAKGYFWVAPANFPYWIELWKATEMSAGMAVNTQQPMGGFNVQQQYIMLPQQQTPSHIGSYGAAGSQFNSPLQEKSSFSPV